MKRALMTIVTIAVVGSSLYLGIRGTDLHARQPKATGLNCYGIYYLTYHSNTSIPTQVLGNANVNGIAIRKYWSTLEPTDGGYVWSSLDTLVSQAKGAGKAYSLSIIAGSTGTPSWLYTAGCQSFTASDGRVVPLPWDPVFLGRFGAFVTQLGSRYGSDPNLVRTQVSAIAASGEEYAVPVANRTDVTNWQKVGYTRAKVLAAWQTLLNDYAGAFPATIRLATFFHSNAFPGIDDNGNLTGKLYDGVLVEEAIPWAISTYPVRFMPATANLSAVFLWQEVSQYAGQVQEGHQMLWFCTGDTTYRMNGGKSAPAPTILQNACNLGIQSGKVKWLEIYKPDIESSDCQSVLAAAQQALTTP